MSQAEKNEDQCYGTDRIHSGPYSLKRDTPTVWKDSGDDQELIEQVGLVADDARQEWLKLEPSCEMISHLLPGGERVGMIDLYRHTGGFGE